MVTESYMRCNIAQFSYIFNHGASGAVLPCYALGTIGFGGCGVVEGKFANGIVRFQLLVLIAVAFWFAGSVFDGEPGPKGLDAPPAQFSAARASLTLARLLGPEVPHPISSPAAQAVRDRIRAEFAALGVPTSIYRAPGCEARPQYGIMLCGTTEDILAEVAPGPGKAIVLMAHSDSVPAGPGASDDESGVATILETVRALKAGGLHTQHPILALITDGEEAGLLGADAFLSNPALRARVGEVINVEARGSAGASFLIQTGEGSGPFIRLYGKAAPHSSATSLVPLVYKMLLNDTDFTVFLNHGLGGFNFAFAGNVAVYHTPQDRRANLSRSTLQFHGDNMLSVARALTTTDFATLKGGDAVYLSAYGILLPPLAASWAVPVAVASLLLLAIAAYLSRGEVLGIGRRLGAFAVPLGAIVLSVLAGWLLHTIAATVSGQPDPSYGTPVWLRLAFACAVAAVLLPLARVVSIRMTAFAVWFWIAGLGLIVAWFLPGLSPYFLFPAAIAALALLIKAVLRGPWNDPEGEAALFIAAIPGMVAWLSLAALTEIIQGLALHPLITIPMAIGAMVLLPLAAARPLPSRASWQVTAALGAAALVLAVVAGLVPSYNPAHPQRLNVNFVDDHINGKALWTVDTGARLPKAYRAVMPFSAEPQSVSPLAFSKSYAAPAGAVRYAAPTADQVTSTAAGTGRTVRFTIHASDSADRVAVIIPKEAGLMRATLFGKSFEPSADNRNPSGAALICASRDCRTMTVTLVLSNRKPVVLTVGEQRYGLPADGANLKAARPADTTPSQSGDTTIVYTKLVLD